MSLSAQKTRGGSIVENMFRAGRLTPALRRWIIAQAEAGHPAEVMLKSMTDAGWTEAAALDALESTLRLKAAEVENRSPPTPKSPSGPTR